MTTLHEFGFPDFRIAPQSDAATLDDMLRQDCAIAEHHGWNNVVRHLDAARSALLDRMRPEDRAVAEAA